MSGSVARRLYLKDPDEVLDFTWNWAAERFVTGEEITTSTFLTSPGGLTVDSSSSTTTTATVWLSGGVRGDSYYVTNRVVTNQGRTYDWTIIISMREC